MHKASCHIRPVAAALSALVAMSLPAASVFAENVKQAAPEAATGRAVKPAVTASRHMVVAANPYASAAGLEVLRAGGSAVDAAIAVQMVLGLVEPQSSGIGGGAFLVHWDRKTRALEALDGRETAPGAARPDRFLDPAGVPRPFDEVTLSPLSVGVPGVVRALEDAHRRHGRLPWAKLFEPAIALASSGFIVSQRLSSLLQAQGAKSFNDAGRALYFDANGMARPAGFRLANPAYAETLRRLAAGGADAFYGGDIAKGILASLNNDMTAEDLAIYRAREREVVCPPFRGYKVCSIGAPSSGGITVGMVLGMLEARQTSPPNRSAPLSTDAVLRDEIDEIKVLIEAEKLAFADRDVYIADPDFSGQRVNLLEPGYLAARASLINPLAPIKKAEPGVPPMKTGALFGVDATQEQKGTSQVSIVDGEGNALSMTTTVQTAFGSGIMTGGFLLNSQLTDFSFKPVDDKGIAIANRLEGGKRPRSSMAPTIIFDPRGEMFSVLGSPGGSTIILYNIKAIVCLIEWHCSVEQAASLPTFGSRNGPLEVEKGTSAETALGPALQAAGAVVNAVEMTSGLGIIEQGQGKLTGAADPRREGEAIGD